MDIIHGQVIIALMTLLFICALASLWIGFVRNERELVRDRIHAEAREQEIALLYGTLQKAHAELNAEMLRRERIHRENIDSELRGSDNPFNPENN